MNTGRCTPVIRGAFVIASIAVAAACGSRSSAVPFVRPIAAPAPAAPGPNKRLGSVVISIKVPRKAAAGASRHVRFISPSATKLKIDLTGWTTTVGLLPATNSSCVSTQSGASYQCDVVAAVPIGSDNFTITTLDDANTELSTGTASTTIVAGAANTMNITLTGVAKSFKIVSSDAHVNGTQAAGYAITGSSPQNFSVIPVDADGNQIVGPGTPAAALGSASAKVTVNSTGSANAFRVKVNAWSSSPVALTATIGSVSSAAPVSTIEELWVADCGDGDPNAVLAFRLDPLTGPTEVAADNIIGTTNDGYSCIVNVAIGPDGNVWTSDSGQNGTTVVEYTPGVPVPVLTKTGFHAPTGLAFDHQGNLWVADSGNNQVLAFAHDTYTLIAGDTIPLSQVTDYLQNALAFDQAGNLYVGQSSDPISVHSFVPGYSTPRTGFDITNKTGNADHAAFDLAFDSSGKLWIANTSGLSLDGYTPGSDVPQTIRFDPGTCPSGIAFSGNGTAWVADSYYGGDPYMVYGYTPGTTSAIETIVGANQLPGVMDDVQTIRIAP